MPTGQHSHAAPGDDRDGLDPNLTAAIHFNEADGFLRIGLVEAESQRRAAIADMGTAHRLWAMKVAESDIIGAGKDVRPHRLDAADTHERTLAFAALTAGNKGMGSDHPTCAIRHMAPCCGDLRPENVLRACQGLVRKAFARRIFVAEGKRRKGDAAVFVAQDQRRLVARDRSPDERPAAIGHHGHRSDPVAGIVIAGHHHNGRLGLGCDPGQEIVELANGAGRRRGAVEDVACDDEDIDRILAHRRLDLIERRLVILVEADPIELSAQMQIGRMENAHPGDPA